MLSRNSEVEIHIGLTLWRLELNILNFDVCAVYNVQERQ